MNLNSKSQKESILKLKKSDSEVQFTQSLFNSNYDSMPQGSELKGMSAIHIDRAYRLEGEGLLIFGWHFSRIKTQSITVFSPEGKYVDIHNLMFYIIRKDAADHLRNEFPEVSNEIGFCCLVPLPSEINDPRILRVEYLNGSKLWLRLPESRYYPNLIKQIMDIFNLLQHSGQMRFKLKELLDHHISPAIEAIQEMHSDYEPSIETYQFGKLHEKPLTSIIVPLYGRYDFLKFQLSHFADDPDFEKVDLIYVVDDPDIIQSVLDTAAQFEDLFDTSFRIIHYFDHLGYAVANNIGAEQSLGQNILLLNSDVLPQEHGWLNRMVTYLDTLPEAGAIAPLLLYHDKSIQHAGMTVCYDHRFPGFILNDHPGKGTFWEGDSSPVEKNSLTAACLLLRLNDYFDVGGLDEGYVLGDYEDSDLCFVLKQAGKRLWLTPDIKLWHMERKSQTIKVTQDSRLLTTLHNSRRFQLSTGIDLGQKS